MASRLGQRLHSIKQAKSQGNAVKKSDCEPEQSHKQPVKVEDIESLLEGVYQIVSIQPQVVERPIWRHL